MWVYVSSSPYPGVSLPIGASKINMRKRPLRHGTTHPRVPDDLTNSTDLYYLQNQKRSQSGQDASTQAVNLFIKA